MGRLKNEETVTFSAFAINIQKAVQMVEIIKSRLGFLHQESTLCDMEYRDKRRKIKSRKITRDDDTVAEGSHKKDEHEHDEAGDHDEGASSGDEVREIARRVTGLKIKLSR